METAMQGRLPEELARTSPNPPLFRVVHDESPEQVDSNAVSIALLRHAQALARDVAASAILVPADAVQSHGELRKLIATGDIPESERNILDPNVEETIKEFSSIDGAFIVRGDGVVLAAGMQLVPAATGRQLPKGLGTRHAAACAITASSAAVAIVISQSTGTISIFKSGEMITDIHRPTNGARLSN